MPKSKNNLTVLGIDPGVATTGYGLIKTEPRSIKHITNGVISTPAKTALAKRLVTINSKVNQLIKNYKPDIIAIESFFFCKKAN